MLRDAVCHEEPTEDEGDLVKQRYAARQQCIENTTYAQAHGQLEKIRGDLLAVLTRLGIALPELPT
jgi:hypothetical protein